RGGAGDRGRGGGRRGRGRGGGRRERRRRRAGAGCRRRGPGRPEGRKHHVPVAARAQGQARLLRAGGAGQDVLEVGGVASVVRVDEVGHPLAASGNQPPRLAAGEDGRHHQLARGDRGGGTRAGVVSGAVRYHGLVERSHRGDVSEVRDRLLQIGGSGRRHRDHEARGRGGGIFPVVEGDVARPAPRRRDRARPGAIDVVRDAYLARSVVLTEPPHQKVAGQNRFTQRELQRREAGAGRGAHSLDEFG